MPTSPVSTVIELEEVTIAASGSLSAEVDLRNRVLAGIHMPAAWTAAAITFEVATVSGGTFQDVYAAGSEVSETVAAGQYVAVDPLYYHGLKYIKVRSGTSGTPVAQAAERVVTLALADRNVS